MTTLPELRMIDAGGIGLRIADEGEGPVVLLLHGWPESWYSWRHQIPALVKAGYRVVVPDMRGYGGSDAPEAIEDYDITHLTGDCVAILDAIGAEDAVVVGHDWGAIIAWHCLLMHAERFWALVAMSVPYGGRPKKSMLNMWRDGFGDDFFYILYFQEPGVAEAEFDADPRGILSRLYVSPKTPRDPPELTDPKMAAGGWIPRLGAPRELPGWLTKEDLDYYVEEFSRAGFRGGINYYRNFQRNWDITPELNGARIKQPVLFIAGEKDIVIRGMDQARLEHVMGRVADDLRGVKLLPQVGHWVQQELPNETNAALLEFLAALD